jgi:hypothetical protein
MIPFHTIAPYLYDIRFNIVPHFMPVCANQSVLFMFYDSNSLCIFYLSHMLHPCHTLGLITIVVFSDEGRERERERERKADTAEALCKMRLRDERQADPITADVRMM